MHEVKDYTTFTTHGLEILILDSEYLPIEAHEDDLDRAIVMMDTGEYTPYDYIIVASHELIIKVMVSENEHLFVLSMGQLARAYHRYGKGHKS